MLGIGLDFGLEVGVGPTGSSCEGSIWLVLLCDRW